MARATASDSSAATEHFDTTARRSLWDEIWIWPNLLSLDAPLVALIWQAFFAKSFHTQLSLSSQLALGLAVWIIYVVDRGFDSLRPLTVPTARHNFYQVHRVAAFTAACLALGGEILVSLFLSPGLFYAGMTIASIVALYLISIHVYKDSPRRWFPKELIVAAVFAAGTVLVPFVNSGYRIRMLIPGAVFAFLCLLNCGAIEYGEWQHFAWLETHPDRTWVMWLASNLELVAITLAVGLTALSIATGRTLLYCSLALSALALVCFERNRCRMSANALQVMADLPLVLPAIVLMLFPRS